MTLRSKKEIALDAFREVWKYNDSLKFRISRNAFSNAIRNTNTPETFLCTRSFTSGYPLPLHSSTDFFRLIILPRSVSYPWGSIHYSFRPPIIRSSYDMSGPYPYIFAHYFSNVIRKWLFPSPAIPYTAVHLSLYLPHFFFSIYTIVIGRDSTPEWHNYSVAFL